MASSSPSGWRSAATNFAATALFVAIALYIAVRLLIAIAPVLIGIGVLVLILYGGWLAHRYRRSRW
jgi:hypothetical protein